MRVLSDGRPRANLGFRTNNEQHEKWCPAVRGDFDGLPIIVPHPNAPDYANGEVGDYA